jgi:recombination protein RecT
MSSQALKAAATGTQVATQSEQPKTIAGLLTDPKIKAQMALALPKHVTADRLARIALTEVRKVPKLAQCDQTSFLGAIMQCCALGLEPGGALGHCYLIPFENKRQNRTEVQFIVGYRGMIDLARRSGQILSIEARAVYAQDHFEVELGLDSKIFHRPDWNASNRGALTFVYAVAKLKDGGVQFVVMSRAEIEAIRDKSQGYSVAKRYARDGVINSPWATNFEEMAKKTVVRRLFKYLPVSIEIQRAVGMDEQADAGLPQDNPLVIDGDYRHVDTDPAIDPPANDEASDDSLTVAEIIAAIDAAADLDALDAAADLIRMLPEGQRTEANEAHRARRVALTSQ